MNLAETLESKTKALRAGEVARLFDVAPQTIYKMAARGTIPSFRVAGAVRFDPRELAKWLRNGTSVDGQSSPRPQHQLLKRTA
jgi:excisionase family DNA binding protein